MHRKVAVEVYSSGLAAAVITTGEIRKKTK